MFGEDLAISKANGLLFGEAPHPVVTKRGLEIGGGIVHPELNFTVSGATAINRDTLSELEKEYSDLADDALKRAVELESEGLVLEFETLLEMTSDPEIGVRLTAALEEKSTEYHQKYGLKTAVRLTPNDSRDLSRPPRMREGVHLESMLELFERGSRVGGDLLSIESTGGKEICDDAIMMGDIRGVIFALGVLGVRDMQFLWPKIVEIARKNGCIAGGDTACGFGNTAMVLADKGYIPRVFAATVRLATIVRSLIAFESGASGPDKDCGYEGIFLKAIAGIPISMEGKTAACAHLSPVGNVSAAAADLWSNESVQNIKLLGGMAPTCYEEQLEYDVRLMNTARRQGRDTAVCLRELFVLSDIERDPQAFILAPESVIPVAQEIIDSETPLEGTIRASLCGLRIIKEAVEQERLRLPDREKEWIPRLLEEIDSIPRGEDAFIDEMMPLLDAGKFLPESYGLC